MKLCILVAYKFLSKNLNFGVNQCISGHVILQNMKVIRLATTRDNRGIRDTTGESRGSLTQTEDQRRRSLTLQEVVGDP